MYTKPVTDFFAKNVSMFTFSGLRQVLFEFSIFPETLKSLSDACGTYP